MLVTGLLTLQTMFVGLGPLGGIIHVPTDAPTIQIAIVKAAPFDTIIVAPGTYSEAISFGGKVITVQSTNPNDPNVVAATIINAGGLGSVVTFSGGEDQVNTILDGFTSPAERSESTPTARARSSVIASSATTARTECTSPTGSSKTARFSTTTIPESPTATARFGAA